jgi:hypothetical protein
MAEQALQATQREEVDVLERELAILADQLEGFRDEVERLGLRDLSILGGGLVTLCGSVSTLLQIVRAQIDQTARSGRGTLGPDALIRSDQVMQDPARGPRQRLRTALHRGEGGQQ